MLPGMDAANFKFDHPLGPIHGYFSEAGLAALHLPHDGGSGRWKPPYLLHSAGNHHWGRVLARQLDLYFSGVRTDFEDIPLDILRATAFQQRVWMAARQIPWGATTTYGALAERIAAGPDGARAVGAALGANPIAILIPCHRFVAADGALTGFAAGLEWKRLLLQTEGALLC
jgi:methylated-DNA-[protein]-cysteine S-methyltransferase